jgi:hypothetical protein
VTIKLGEQLESVLAMRIAEGLQSVTLNNDFATFPALAWADELHEQLTDDARLKLDRYCGEPGLKRYLLSELNADLARRPASMDTNRIRALVEFDQFRNPIAYARRLVDKLKSIPLRYRATLALPAEISEPILDEIDDALTLGSGIEICKGSALTRPFPLNSPNPRVDMYLFRDLFSGGEQERKVFEDRLYFTMPVLGYATSSSSGVISRTFEDYIKAFYGAGMAQGLFSNDWFFAHGEILPYITIHAEEDETELIATEKVEEELSQANQHLSTSEFASRNKSDIWAAYQTAMQKIRTIYSDEKDARKLFTACIWYYRAIINKRPLDRLLEATIAIEVLLGDRQVSEGVGLSNILGNRCAFLLGTTSVQRQNILSLFNRIYFLRSNIVHEGRHKLEPGEAKTVSAAIQLCGAIISKEMEVRRPVSA